MKEMVHWMTRMVLCVRSCALLCACFAMVLGGSAWAAEYDIGGDSGGTWKSVVSGLTESDEPGDTVNLLGDHSTGEAVNDNGIFLHLTSKGSHTISANRANRFFSDNGSVSGAYLEVSGKITFADGYAESGNGGAFLCKSTGPLDFTLVDGNSSLTFSNNYDSGGRNDIYATSPLDLNTEGTNGECGTFNFGGGFITTKENVEDADTYVEVSNSVVNLGAGSITKTDGIEIDVYSTVNVYLSEGTVFQPGTVSGAGTLNFYGEGTSGNVTLSADGVGTANVNLKNGSKLTLGAGSESAAASLNLDNATLNIDLGNNTTFQLTDITAENSVINVTASSEAGSNSLFTNSDGNGVALPSGVTCNIYLPFDTTKKVAYLDGETVTTKECDGIVFEMNGKTSKDTISLLTDTDNEEVRNTITDNTLIVTADVDEDRTSAIAGTVNIQSNTQDNIRTVNAPTNNSLLTSNGTVNLNLDNITIRGKSLTSTAGDINLTGQNVTLVHKGNDQVILKVAKGGTVNFTNGTFTVGSTIAGNANVENSIITVGENTGTPDTYTVDGDFTTTASTFVLDVFVPGTVGGVNDKLEITGDATLGTNTVFKFNEYGAAEIKQGDEFTILTATGVISGLANILGDGGYPDWTFRVVGNNLVATAGAPVPAGATVPIPEPGSWLLMLLGFLGIWRGRKNG